jgi:hypothetical protein
MLHLRGTGGIVSECSFSVEVINDVASDDDDRTRVMLVTYYVRRM